MVISVVLLRYAWTHREGADLSKSDYKSFPFLFALFMARPLVYGSEEEESASATYSVNGSSFLKD
jgi:hypothetical protein